MSKAARPSHRACKALPRMAASTIRKASTVPLAVYRCTTKALVCNHLDVVRSVPAVPSTCKGCTVLRSAGICCCWFCISSAIDPLLIYPSFTSIISITDVDSLRFFDPAALFVEIQSFLCRLFSRQIGKEVTQQGLFGFVTPQILLCPVSHHAQTDHWVANGLL